MEEAVSRAITRFTFLATVVVVMCHVDDAMPIAGRTWLVRYLGGSFSDVNVHNFFFISGYLLARHVGEDGWWKSTIKKRIHSLILPYLIWCAIYGFVFHGAPLIRFMTSHDITPMQACVVLARNVQQIFGLGFLTHPADFPLWYIKTLFYFILIFPIALPFLTHKNRLLLLILGLLAGRWMLCKYLPQVGPCLGTSFNLLGFVFFVCGAFCSIHKVPPPKWLYRCSPIVPLTIWFVVQTWPFIPYINRLGGVLGPGGVAVSVFCLLWIAFSSKWDVSDNLSRSCFFIYAAHMMVLHYCAKLNPFALTIMRPELWYVLLVVFIVVICTAMANVLYMVNPRILAALTGGRVARAKQSVQMRIV